jgi:dTDP-glucose 4,6-dehydratase
VKKILVTGGAGFLGSHLCSRLVERGDHVLCVDNYFTGSKKNIEHLLEYKNFEVIRQDVCFPLYVEVDEIYNLACPASPKYYQKDPIQTLKTSVLGAYNLLGLAKRTGAKILQASTSEVYGDPLVHPQTEEYYGNVNTIGPRGVYDEAKRFQESITMAYHTFHGVETRIVRIFNTYGPRMRLNDGRVIPAFIGQALRGEDLTIFGDGSQTRSFCYVDDQVEGIFRLLHSDYHLPVNIGNPDEITIKDFAEEIIKLTGTNQKVVYHPLPINDPMQRQPDTTKAKEILGWEAKVSRSEGMKITYDYFKTLSAEELLKEDHKDFTNYIH